MNVHDSERIAGLLDEAGFMPAESGVQADIVVFNTCAVRENADNKLYGNLSFLAPIKKANPSMQIAVGGCLAQKDQAIILKKAPYVRTMWAHYLSYLNEHALKKSRRSRSLKRSNISHPLFPPVAFQLFHHGSLSRSAATTLVHSALSLHCAGLRKIAQ
jgi:tRNA A37 methylthiotransferase MiaB